MSKLTVLQIVNSSLWIAVLAARVGCIIEAHPAPNTRPSQPSPNYPSQFAIDEELIGELETAASQSFISSPLNVLSGGISSSKKHPSSSNFGQYGQSKITHKPPKTSPETTTTRKIEPLEDSTTEHEYSDNDSCSGKGDGYYPNLGSGCTSYYYCTAGYQATYICAPGTQFNGQRCERGYQCPSLTAGHHVVNVCENRSNGYYPSTTSGHGANYFYCFQQNKVIELQCDTGKVFVGDKCVSQSDDQTSAEEAAAQTCGRNGFFTDTQSNCQRYFYCIGGEKTELRCQTEYVFNGDICVHKSRYQCPYKGQKTGRGLNEKVDSERTTPTLTVDDDETSSESNIVQKRSTGTQQSTMVTK